ncbi:MAG TPA: zf-HC2 domain-containing protein [Candidatus Angelobacter sp.]
MTSPLMNHQDAVSSLAVERYLLGELKDEERAAFEEHYLNCDECLDAVTFGDEFMEAGREIARENLPVPIRPPAPVPRSLVELLKGWFPPVPTLASALAVCAMSTVYLGVQLVLIAHKEQPQVVATKVVYLGQGTHDRGPADKSTGPGDRGPGDKSTDSRTKQPAAYEPFQADMDIPDHAPFAFYEGQINGPGNSLAFPIPADRMQPGSTLRINAPGLPSGRYELVIYGRNDANQVKGKVDVARYRFVVP